MQPNAQEVPGYFVWEAPGKSLAIHLNLNVVDRLGAEVARGFGLVPKRGAEVGGVLLGSVQIGEKTIVRIEGFAPVACEYRRGPSYLLGEDEQTAFAAAAGGSEPGYAPVGYYRSHTRDGEMSLGAEDLELMGRLFPEPHHVALLVRPFATKVSVAGFFVRGDDGAFPAATPREFPFRRRELTGEEAPPRRSLEEHPVRVRAPQAEPEDPPAALHEAGPVYPATPVDVAPARKPRGGWVWLPLSFIFLVLGVALGFQAALTFAPELRTRADAEAFRLNLTAGRNGDSLTVRWDRDSPAVRAALRGVLEIEDGDASQPVQLDPAHLREGSVIYQNTSPVVRFRLVLYMGANSTVNETVEWIQ
jgi:hypothetical protein